MNAILLSMIAVFTWSPGPYDLYRLIIIIPVGGRYYPLSFYTRETSYQLPAFMWQLADSGQWPYWSVLGIDTANRDWEVAGPWSFFKAE